MYVLCMFVNKLKFLCSLKCHGSVNDEIPVFAFWICISKMHYQSSKYNYKQYGKCAYNNQKKALYTVNVHQVLIRKMCLKSAITQTNPIFIELVFMSIL